MPYDIVIIDECSMINVGLFLSALRAVKIGGKIILVFDDAQLPAIGTEPVTKDLLTSNYCIQRLTKIHRQAENLVLN
jgi:exodeoxyribonuclease V alpha subunit